MRYIFVFRIDSGSEEDIVGYCQQKGLFIGNCTKISHPAAKYKSFRLNVLTGQMGIVLNERFWPNGVKVKKFISKPN